ncbi:glycosyltransferase [Candidatus Pacearchaeota archaeon]|nr:glycosyltransferase [Candidatus Pacearchaeota archaeon]
MISLIVTAYEDPESTKESIKRILTQKNFHKKFELIAACPDKPTKKVIMEYKKKYPQIVKYVKQEECEIRKNKLMNKIIKLAQGDILIWTDGNKFLEDNAISLILKPFEDPKVGVVGGRPTAMNSRDNLLGYWAHLLTNASDKMREIRYKKGYLVEHCANLLAIRKGIINEIPLDVAEDAIISYMITEKGYKNVYVKEAKVLVMYPRNFKDWIKQKVRSIKAHEALNKYINKKNIKMKSFSNEIFYGIYLSLSFPKNIKEFYWTLLLYPARLYIWLRAFYEIKIKKQTYSSKWSRSESTKILDYEHKK